MPVHMSQVYLSNSSAVMLAAKRSVGVAPDVNLRNQLHTGNEAGKQGIHTDFEIIVDITRSPKRGITGLTKRTSSILFFFFERSIFHSLHMIRDWSKELDFDLSLA